VGYVSTLVASLASVLLSLVLVVFMLINREDLRDRVMRVIGARHVTTTTKAVDEAFHRLSRFLLMQLTINALFGAILAVGFYWAGIRYALLWGFLAAVMRYLPYVGIWIAAAFPLTLSLAIADGWTQPVLVFAFFMVVEIVTANFIEPYWFGHSIGVSAVALLVSAAFWAFLWGPIGMVLAIPLTIVIVVLGTYVSQFQFLTILMSVEPALPVRVSFYQRLLARERPAAQTLAAEHLAGSSREAVFDELLIGALAAVRRDRRMEKITEEDQEYVLTTIAGIAEETAQGPEGPAAPHPGDPASAAIPADEGSTNGEEPLDGLPARESNEARKSHPAAETSTEAANGVPTGPVEQPRRSGKARRLLICPARDAVDGVGCQLLKHLINPEQWKVEIADVEDSWRELARRIRTFKPDAVCIGSVPPGGLESVRYLCRRIRDRHRSKPLLVGRWGIRRKRELEQVRVRRCGADKVATSLTETLRHLSDRSRAPAGKAASNGRPQQVGSA
jgi:hypothetical protein